MRRLVGQHKLAELWLVDRDAAGTHGRDLVLIGVDADDLVAEIGEAGPDTNPT